MKNPTVNESLVLDGLASGLYTDADGFEHPVALKVDATGVLATSGAGGGGGGGDASAANQVITNTEIGIVTETAPASDTASSGLNGRLQRIAQRLTSLIALLPASIGVKLTATSLSTTIATDDAMVGALTETAPATDTASSGLNGRLQRIAQRITSLISLLPASLGVKLTATSLSTTIATDDAMVGALTETAPASDTASSGLNGRLQRVAQRLTALIALLPASIGVKLTATSLSTTIATDDVMVGALTETAPATDTASSGLNGRLQRVAQRLTSIIALLPASIGVKLTATSLSTTIATDDAILGALTETAPASDTASSGHNGRLQRIAQRITSLIALLPSAIGPQTAAASLSVVAVQTGAAVSIDVTRPANATPYSAGDVVGGAITFTSMAAANAASLQIVGAALRCDVAAVPSGMVNMRLYLYSVTPPSAIADNAAWDLPSGDRASFMGYIDIGTPVDLGSTLFVQADNVNHLVKLGASTSLFAYLVTTAAYTPAGNSENYNVTLRALAV